MPADHPEPVVLKHPGELVQRFQAALHRVPPETLASPTARERVPQTIVLGQQGSCVVAGFAALVLDRLLGGARTTATPEDRGPPPMP